MEHQASPAAVASAPSHPNFFDFLHRMRQPAAADLVRTIKSFIVSFSFHTSDSEEDGKKVQDFLTTMENTIREHPLWAHAADEQIESAMEGLEKYIMTKLFNRTFASSSDDVNLDIQIAEKIHLLQHFIKPDHLDVPKVLQSEASSLLAAKELQKINSFKAPREKLLCIMNCCHIINNLLLNITMFTNHVAAGADDFLPVLIYVTIKANPPQLHSNLKFIQLFRRHSALVSEVEYYLTNLISAKMFINSINASSLSMEESEFQKNMQLARLASEQSIAEPHGRSEVSALTMRRHGKDVHVEGSKYPYLEAEAEELLFEDVRQLLGLYKQVVKKYSMLTEALRELSLDESELLHVRKEPQNKQLKEMIKQQVS